MEYHHLDFFRLPLSNAIRFDQVKETGSQKTTISKLHLFTELLHIRQRFGLVIALKIKWFNQIFAAWYALTEVFLNLKHQICLS